MVFQFFLILHKSLGINFLIPINYQRANLENGKNVKTVKQLLIIKNSDRKDLFYRSERVACKIQVIKREKIFFGAGMWSLGLL